jgi:hypothetical protein
VRSQCEDCRLVGRSGALAVSIHHDDRGKHRRRQGHRVRPLPGVEDGRAGARGLPSARTGEAAVSAVLSCVSPPIGTCPSAAVGHRTSPHRRLRFDGNASVNTASPLTTALLLRVLVMWCGVLVCCVFDSFKTELIADRVRASLSCPELQSYQRRLGTRSLRPTKQACWCRRLRLLPVVQTERLLGVMRDASFHA